MLSPRKSGTSFVFSRSMFKLIGKPVFLVLLFATSFPLVTIAAQPVGSCSRFAVSSPLEKPLPVRDLKYSNAKEYFELNRPFVEGTRKVLEVYESSMRRTLKSKQVKDRRAYDYGLSLISYIYQKLDAVEKIDNVPLLKEGLYEIHLLQIEFAEIFPSTNYRPNGEFYISPSFKLENLKPFIEFKSHMDSSLKAASSYLHESVIEPLFVIGKVRTPPNFKSLAKIDFDIPIHRSGISTPSTANLLAQGFFPLEAPLYSQSAHKTTMTPKQYKAHDFEHWGKVIRNRKLQLSKYLKNSNAKLAPEVQNWRRLVNSKTLWVWLRDKANQELSKVDKEVFYLFFHQRLFEEAKALNSNVKLEAFELVNDAVAGKHNNLYENSYERFPNLESHFKYVSEWISEAQKEFNETHN